MGYLGVGVRLGEARTQTVLVQYLVLEAFVGPRPKGMYCCHKDGSKTNNALDNLRWGTPQSNCDDAGRHGTKTQGERVHCAKLTEELVRAIRTSGEPHRSLAERLGVSRRTITDAITRTTWAHVT